LIKLIKGGEVYSPEYLGKKDVLILFNKIALVKDEIDISFGNDVEMEIIDGSNKFIVPGFIDSHVHITGGGGEGGFKTRTPEINLTEITTAGITTIVGCLGTDGITRSMEALLAKAKGLEEEGITTFIYTGSYRLPLVTISGDVMKDLLVIEKVIGAGEVAITDHRSSQPSIEALKQLAGAASVGGILSGKAGVVVFHVGDGEEMLNKVFEIIKDTDLPFSQFIPTHLNRNSKLLVEAIRYGIAGGNIDFTTSSGKDTSEKSELRASIALKQSLDSGVPDNRITFTSDGHGSLPVFDKNKQFIGLDVGNVSSLYSEVRDAVLNEKVPLEIALKTITSNPSDILKLKGKGKLLKGFDADITILNKKDLSIETVIAMGKVMVKDKKTIVFGTFENNL
jgi:beta-aspartyl-dipeptidase (metallo-type)